MDPSLTSKERLEAYLQYMETQVDAEIIRNGEPLNLRRSVGKREVELLISGGDRFHGLMDGERPVSMGWRQSLWIMLIAGDLYLVHCW